jgi:hypothetical protein
MKASELRIANYVLDERGEADTVSGISQEFVYLGRNPVNKIHLTEAKPIPITEEWLYKFGVDKDNNTLDKGKISYSLSWKMFYWGDDVIDHKIEYVHQLQNLYFALTGEELTIKNQ